MTAFGKGLIESAEQALAIARGEADPATYQVHVPPKIDVRAIRTGLGLTQEARPLLLQLLRLLLELRSSLTQRSARRASRTGCTLGSSCSRTRRPSGCLGRNSALSRRLSPRLRS